MCAAQPHVMGDVESYVQKNFTAPIDTWALSDAQLLMERAQKRRGVFIFPVERLFVLMQKVSFFECVCVCLFVCVQVYNVQLVIFHFKICQFSFHNSLDCHNYWFRECLTECIIKDSIDSLLYCSNWISFANVQ